MVLMVALIVLNFAGICCFGSLLIDCKIEGGIFMIGCFTNSIFLRMLVRKGGVKHEMFLQWSNNLRSWEGLSCSYRQWRHFIWLFI